jgi:two-component system response regulator YesN
LYKVCLLDDQPFVRQGLREIIDWKSLDCEIAAEWSTAVNAIKEIEQIRPDIIISDIVMPGLDGLTLMDMLNQSRIPVYTIFLSAHRNFDYAQRAIDLGAMDYLVKPTDPKEVIRAVTKCIQRLNEKKPAFREKEHEIFSLLIQKKPPIEPILTDQQLYYTVFTVRFDETSNMMLIMQDSVELLRRKLDPTHLVAVIQVIDKVIIVFSSNEPFMLKKQTMEWAEEIQFWHRQLLDTSISIGISPCWQGSEHLHEQYLEALKVLDMTFYYGKNTILSYEIMERHGENPYEAVNFQSPHNEEQLLEAIKQGEEEKVVILMEQWFDAFIQQKVNENDIKFQIYKWIFYAVLHVPLDPQDKQEWERQAQTILAANSLTEIKKILGNMISLMIGQFKSDLKDHHQLVIYQVEKYIQEHYHDPNTSLTAVAEHVHLSANYVSRLMKRKIGKTFTEWLNEYRMVEAKKLLQNKKNKSYWVAERVGIPDARYFSQLFRKHTNSTPSEYKNQFND